jgi:hypothetical protein
MFDSSGNFESNSSIVSSISGLHGKDLLEKGLKVLGLPDDLIGSDLNPILIQSSRGLLKLVIPKTSETTQFLDIIDKSGGDWRKLTADTEQYLTSKILLPQAQTIISDFKSKLSTLDWLLPIQLPSK